MAAALALGLVLPGGGPARLAARPAAVAGPGQAPLPVVYPGHPRLIVGGYRGMPVAALRAACARPELAPQCAQIGGRHVLDDAMRYLLSGDRAAADAVAAVLDGWAGCEAGDAGVEHSDWGGWALAYDWTWAALPERLRDRTQGHLVSCGQALVASLEGNGPHLWHGYGSLAASLALMALAVDPGTPGRDPLLAKALARFRGNALAAYAVVGGAWPEGYSYERSHFFSADPPGQAVLDALRAWDSAVERDHPDHASVFETIAAEEGDWLRGLGYHLLYGSLDAYGPGGKRSLLRGGDLPGGQAWPNKQYRPFVDAIARVYGDGVLAGWGKDLEADWPFVGGEGSYHPIHRYSLPLNLPLDLRPRPPDALPLARVWAREDLGYLISRSGWAPGETLLAYRAGAWFTGHQHLDQGHLDAWRKGPLLVDSGVYASWGSEHREAYYLRAIAHNTLLVHQDGEDFEEHPGSGVDVNDDGQRVHTYTRLGCAQCMQSVAEWRSNLGRGLHFEAGRLTAFEDGPGYTVVSSELTAAYNSSAYSTAGNRPKVALVLRDLVYLRPGLVFVTDRLRLAPGASAPRAAWHLPAAPVLEDARLLEGSPDDGLLASDHGRFDLDNGSGGHLRGSLLWPPAARLLAVGGPAHRYWVAGANRAGGAAGLEGAPATPGLWRVELGPAVWDVDNVLVTALQIGDTGQPLPEPRAALLPGAGPGLAPARVLSVDGPAAATVVVGGAALPPEPLRFTQLAIDGQPAQDWLLVDLLPGGTYRLGWGELPGGLVGLRAGRASAEGVLALSSPPLSGTVAIGHCPAPADAPGPWRALCVAPPEPGASPTAIASATAPPRPTPGASPTGAAGPGPARAFLPWAGRR